MAKEPQNLARTPKEKTPPPPTPVPKEYIQKQHVANRRATTYPQEPPMELATTEKPGTLATQEGTETVAPQDPEELAPQRHPQRMASTKTRKHPMGPRNSRRKAVARRNERLLGMELIVTEVNLTKDQLSLLHKGRSFVPGPPRKSIQLEALSSSLGKLEDDANRNFTEALLPGQKILPTREKRKWPPQLPAIPRKKESPRKMPGLHEKVTEHMQKLEKEIHTQKRPNLSKKERAALDLLKKDANIVIKKADKDGALVVLKTESYIKMGNQHLRDKETYETVGNPEEALQAVTRESKLLVNRFHTLDNIKEKVRSFTAGQRDALLQHKASIPHWYVLPKTHKAIDEDTGTWPGRPVLSGCSAPTRPVDRLLTTFLTPLLELLPERLQDTSDFLRKMKDSPRFPKDSIIFSFDIVSLYPSIPQEEAAWVVANFYEKNYGYVQGRLAADFNITPPPPYLIKEGIDHVLRGTLLRFDNKFYRQCKGTAIGASVSVALAEIFVHVSIEKKRKKLRKQPEIFYRYIDDIFGIFTGTEEELQQYHKELNELHPDLKFTLEWSKEKLPFLDTMVYWDTEMRPQTSTFYKPSNTHQYLHFLSSHHPSLKKSLPFSQGIRIKRIISERKNLDKALQEMVNFFSKRGYSRQILMKALERLEGIPRETLLHNDTARNMERSIIPMVYSQTLATPIRQSINEIWEWLKEDSKGKPWENRFKGPPPMIAWMKDKSIENIIIRAQFPSPLTE